LENTIRPFPHEAAQREGDGHEGEKGKSKRREKVGIKYIFSLEQDKIVPFLPIMLHLLDYFSSQIENSLQHSPHIKPGRSGGRRVGKARF
jgi:hypothetical protein